MLISTKREYSLENPFYNAWSNWDGEGKELKLPEADYWQDGYDQAAIDTSTFLKMEQQVDAMQNLLAANARVLRKQIEEEIRKELTPDENLPSQNPVGS